MAEPEKDPPPPEWTDEEIVTHAEEAGAMVNKKKTQIFIAAGWPPGPESDFIRGEMIDVSARLHDSLNDVVGYGLNPTTEACRGLAAAGLDVQLLNAEADDLIDAAREEGTPLDTVAVGAKYSAALALLDTLVHAEIVNGEVVLTGKIAEVRTALEAAALAASQGG